MIYPVDSAIQRLNNPGLVDRAIQPLNNQDQAVVVQTLDSAIHRIKIYPMDSAVGFPNTYPLDNDLSGGLCTIQRLNNPGCTLTTQLSFLLLLIREWNVN